MLSTPGAPPTNGERCTPKMRLEELLQPENYLAMIRKIARGEIVVVKEIEDILELVNGDRKRLEAILIGLTRKLLEINRPVIYPIEVIVIPRFPFSKHPMVDWGPFKAKDYKDPEVNRIKDVSSRLGYLINSGFIGRHFVLIDIDSENVPKSLEFDVKTSRGYHKLFYVPKFPAVEFKIGGNSSTKYKIKCGEVDIELISGSNYLISNPLQSRYIQIENGKFNIRKYKILSKRAEYAFNSADLTPLQADIPDIQEYLCILFRELGCEGFCKELELKPLEKEDAANDLPRVNPKESKFNSRRLPIVGAMTYSEFKAELEKRAALLPTCIKHALFGSVEKGHRYYHLRLILAVLPYFVGLNDQNIEALVQDFSERSNSTRGDVRLWLYDAKYFTGKIEVEDTGIHVPSAYGVPSETWSDFDALGYCNNCPLRESCKNRPGPEKRRLIVSYIEELLGSAQ